MVLFYHPHFEVTDTCRNNSYEIKTVNWRNDYKRTCPCYFHLPLREDVCVVTPLTKADFRILTLHSQLYLGSKLWTRVETLKFFQSTF